MPKSNQKFIKRPRNIYLDHASGVLANPGSIHKEGMNAKKKLQDARVKVAKVLYARPAEIIFTSSGTESNNLAIQGVVFASRMKMLPHIITTNIEHSSILETFRILKKRKLAEITILPVESNGIIDPKKIKKAIKKNTVLVSVNYANSEIGTIQPIREIAKEIRHYRKTSTNAFTKDSPSQIYEGQSFVGFPIFHIDAVQAVNYLDLNVEKLGVDLLTLSGNKIEGAGRVGVLYKKKNVLLEPIFGGGGQEGGFRPGTENLAEIIKFANALELVEKIKDKEVKRLTKLRDYFIKEIQKMSKTVFDVKNAGIIINGDLEKRLPNNVNVTIPNIPSDLLVIELSSFGIMTSSKSACKMGDGKASHVIEALRIQGKTPHSEEDGSIRFSMGRETIKNDIVFTIKALSDVLKKLKKWYTPKLI